MRSSHVSEQLRYVSCAWIPCTFGVRDLYHVQVHFGQVQNSFQALVFCASTGPRY